MAQKVKVKISGLKTNPSQLQVPEGALRIAKNINVNSPDTASSRRGFKKYGTQLTGSAFNGFFEYDDTIIAHYGSSLYRDSDDAGTWSAYSGTYDAADSDIGIRAVQSNGSFFFTTDEGLKKLESVTGTPAQAGNIKAIGFDAALTGASGFFTDDKQVAYRVLWGYTDANKVVNYGTPSERVEVINNVGGGATRDVALTIYIPNGVTTDYFYQVYRSGFSADASTVANDELQLVYEDNPTAAQISAGSISIIDNTPDSLRGETIYTAPTQQGIEQANDTPPLAKDVVMYKNYCFFANTKTKHRKYITLLAVQGDNGMELGDIITIGGVDFTAAAAQDHTAGEFKVYTTGTAAENIANTAQSLAQVINRYASNTITYAYYVSGYDELPGKILLERRDLTDTSFAITYNNVNTGEDEGKMWNPVLPTSGTSVSSDNEVKPNRIYISKFQQVDSVPIAQYLDAGTEDSAIQRILALRDSLFVMKDNGEIYRLVGDDINNFQLSLFDNTTKIIGPRTAAVFNNQIFMFSEQGVVAISDSGVVARSFEIEDQLRTFYNSTTFPTNAYAFSYESDRKYILYVGTAYAGKETYVYNSFTNSWTNWDTDYEAGFVKAADDKIYWGKSDGYVYQERKSFDRWDYADDSYDVTIQSSSDTSVIVEVQEDEYEVGQSLRQINTRSYVSAIDDTDAHTTGTSGSLTSPDATYDTASQEIPIASLVGGIAVTCNVYAGDMRWRFQSTIGGYATPDVFNAHATGDYGTVYFDPQGSGWVVAFLNPMADGLKTFTLPKSADDDILGGSFLYYFHAAAWTYAFQNNTSKIVVDLYGNVFKDSIADDNLVVTINGNTGPAGAADPDVYNVKDLTVENTRNWLAGSATLDDYIDCELQWTEVFGDNPGTVKRWQELTVFFRSMNDKFDVIFGNNFDNVNKITQEITPTYIGAGWGSLPWGSGPWGGTTGGNQENRTWFPLNLARAIWQNIKIQTNRAFTDFSLNGLSIWFETMDTEFTKET